MAQRCLEAGADYNDWCRWQLQDVIATVAGRLGLGMTMFEASNAKTAEWFIKRYGPKVYSTVSPS
jgi:phosphosulfolactate synthase (CoM biosynthesis protein A)